MLVLPKVTTSASTYNIRPNRNHLSSFVFFPFIHTVHSISTKYCPWLCGMLPYFPHMSLVVLLYQSHVHLVLFSFYFGFDCQWEPGLWPLVRKVEYWLNWFIKVPLRGYMTVTCIKVLSYNVWKEPFSLFENSRTFCPLYIIISFHDLRCWKGRKTPIIHFSQSILSLHEHCRRAPLTVADFIWQRKLVNYICFHQ